MMEDSPLPWQVEETNSNSEINFDPLENQNEGEEMDTEKQRFSCIICDKTFSDKYYIRKQRKLRDCGWSN